MDVLIGVSQRGRECGTQHELTLWGAFKKQLGDGCQRGQAHLDILICKVPGDRLQQIGRILRRHILSTIASIRLSCNTSRAESL